MCVHKRVSLSVCMYVCIHISKADTHTYINLHLFGLLYLPTLTYLLTHLNAFSCKHIDLSAHQSAYQSTYLPFYLPVYLPTHLSIYLSTHLYIYIHIKENARVHKVVPRGWHSDRVFGFLHQGVLILPSNAVHFWVAKYFLREGQLTINQNRAPYQGSM